jgi:hypothetical protein
MANSIPTAINTANIVSALSSPDVVKKGLDALDPKLREYLKTGQGREVLRQIAQEQNIDLQQAAFPEQASENTARKFESEPISLDEMESIDADMKAIEETGRPTSSTRLPEVPANLEILEAEDILLRNLGLDFEGVTKGIPKRANPDNLSLPVPETQPTSEAEKRRLAVERQKHDENVVNGVTEDELMRNLGFDFDSVNKSAEERTAEQQLLQKQLEVIDNLDQRPPADFDEVKARNNRRVANDILKDSRRKAENPSKGQKLAQDTTPKVRAKVGANSTNYTEHEKFEIRTSPSLEEAAKKLRIPEIATDSEAASIREEYETRRDNELDVADSRRLAAHKRARELFTQSQRGTARSQEAFIIARNAMAQNTKNMVEGIQTPIGEGAEFPDYMDSQLLADVLATTYKFGGFAGSLVPQIKAWVAKSAGLLIRC